MSETVTVTQLNTRVREHLNQSPGLRDIWVSGEISNLKRYTSGHYYFTLKDQGSEIRGVMFSGSRSRIDFEPVDNMKVLAFGRVDLYVQRGSYQFIVETMRRSGVGDLYMEFERLKARLQAEGLFDPARKRPLPRYPRTIGVVTSPTGAVIHDIITTSASRFPADIVLAPAKVQGEGAAESIVAGIELLNRHGVDVIIVGRGGGSIEDLWAFNEEPVARAIAASRAPVVSAVGHETDFTIADFVADVRAPTPTGAAAVILRDRTEVRGQVDNISLRMNRAVAAAVGEMRARFELADARLSPRRASESLDVLRMRLDDLSARSDRAPWDVLRAMGGRFAVADARLSPEKALSDISGHADDADGALDRIGMMVSHTVDLAVRRMVSVGERPENAVMRTMARSTDSLESLGERLEGLNPVNVLGRGYAMVTSADGTVVSSVGDMDEGDKVTIHLGDGRAVAEIMDKEMRT